MKVTLLLLATLLLTASARTINVVGEGSASAVPDLATIDAGVTTTATTAVAALSENNRKFARVVAVLKEQGIADTDVQTSSFDVFQDTRGRRENRTRVYTVSNSISIKVRDVDAVGGVLDALVRAGSNEINGVTFGLEDSQMTKDKARRLAVADAKRKAMLFAESAGVELGKVLAISETAIQAPRENQFAEAAFGTQADTFVSGGELDVEVKVFVLFDIAE
ncbi:unnamed protein product [Chondrus crispus]|uniref:26 kDa periplasmic immunogenic protein n=1 Tax=Chondrus crispus TaxID=2769 RepID=R7Q696_CHOCR|nr:unnamed protein product [Chondrus crispus]CDF32916.1 unnamed protein product [Chondrus crispus]|eukprot:XP_005712719.1 unnamed protein product [Chondrus crispus]